MLNKPIGSPMFDDDDNKSMPACLETMETQNAIETGKSENLGRKCVRK